MKKYLKILLIGLIALFPILILIAHAMQGMPNNIIYEGTISDIGGNVVKNPVSIRFSIWKNGDFVSSDILPLGEINFLNSNFTGYSEVQDITPDPITGYFITRVGIINPLPVLDSSIHKYLQIEYKIQGNPDSLYKIVDIDGVQNTIDRKFIDIVPYAINADYLDNFDIGFGSGNIAILGNGGRFNPANIPNSVDDESFTISNIAGLTDTKLIFNKNVTGILKWLPMERKFNISNSLTISGDLDVSGLGIFNGRNLNAYFDKLDTVETGATVAKPADEISFSASGFNANNINDALIELNNKSFTDTDDQTALEVPFSAYGFNSENVQDAIVESTNLVTDDQTASEVSFTAGNGITSTDVQNAIIEVKDSFIDTDNQNAGEVAYNPSLGMTSTNVQGAIDELSQHYFGSPLHGFTSTLSWPSLSGTEGGPTSNGFDKNMGYTMPSNGRIVYSAINSDPYDSSANGEYQVTKNDNGAYDSNKVMTKIFLNQTGAGDLNNSAYLTSPIIGPLGLSFQAGDVLRAYHVGRKDTSSNLTIGIVFDYINQGSGGGGSVQSYNLTAFSIECDNESDLPNWGGGNGPSIINEEIAYNYVQDSSGECEFSDGTEFQYYLGDTSNPGDNNGKVSSWTTFEADSNGKAQVYLNNLGNSNKLWLREVYKNGNIKFTGSNTHKKYSAEFYCHDDVLHYDNFEKIQNPNQNSHYYCIAFNAED